MRHKKQKAKFLTTEYSNHLNCSNQLLLNALCWPPNWLSGYCGRTFCLGPLSRVPKSPPAAPSSKLPKAVLNDPPAASCCDAVVFWFSLAFLISPDLSE